MATWRLCLDGWTFLRSMRWLTLLVVTLIRGGKTVFHHGYSPSPESHCFVSRLARTHCGLGRLGLDGTNGPELNVGIEPNAETFEHLKL